MNGMILRLMTSLMTLVIDQSSKGIQQMENSLKINQIQYSRVEVRGVEPRSEIKIQRTSTYIVCFIWTLSYQTDKDHLKSACFGIHFNCTGDSISYFT